MLRSGLALAAGALTLLVAASAFEPADARDGRGGARAFHGGGGSHARRHGLRGHHFRGGPRHFSGGHVRHRRFGRIGPGIVLGVPFAAYGAYSYTATCDWLHRKAVITGSPYWWYRFEACLDGAY